MKSAPQWRQDITRTHLDLSLPEPDLELLNLEGHHLPLDDERGGHGILVALLGLLQLVFDQLQLQLLSLEHLRVFERVFLG